MKKLLFNISAVLIFVLFFTWLSMKFVFYYPECYRLERLSEDAEALEMIESWARMQFLNGGESRELDIKNLEFLELSKQQNFSIYYLNRSKEGVVYISFGAGYRYRFYVFEQVTDEYKIKLLKGLKEIDRNMGYECGG